MLLILETWNARNIGRRAKLGRKEKDHERQHSSVRRSSSCGSCGRKSRNGKSTYSLAIMGLLTRKTKILFAILGLQCSAEDEVPWGSHESFLDRCLFNILFFTLLYHFSSREEYNVLGSGRDLSGGADSSLLSEESWIVVHLNFSRQAVTKRSFNGI